MLSYIINKPKGATMTYNEAIEIYDGNVKALAKDLEVTYQMVYKYKKKPDALLPKHKIFMLKTKLALKPKIKMSAKGEVEKANV
jgi:hypothetical protein